MAQINDSIKSLLAEHSLAELLQAAVVEHHAKLRVDEDAKPHALSSFRLTDDEWKQFKSHLLDGGGVMEDHDLTRDILQSLHDDDQAAFFHLLPHLLKARMNINAHTRQLPGGGVQIAGAPKAELDKLLKK